EPHALDGHARDRRADPGLCGVGGLPHRGRHGGRGWGAADQFYEDPASGARVVAVLGGLGGLADPGAGALCRPPFLAPDRGYGHPQATATVLPTSLAPTGEQLATVAQKHLPQRTCPILRWPNLCLNSYTALGLGSFGDAVPGEGIRRGGDSSEQCPTLIEVNLADRASICGRGVDRDIGRGLENVPVGGGSEGHIWSGQGGPDMPIPT